MQRCVRTERTAVHILLAAFISCPWTNHDLSEELLDWWKCQMQWKFSPRIYAVICFIYIECVGGMIRLSTNLLISRHIHGGIKSCRRAEYPPTMWWKTSNADVAHPDRNCIPNGKAAQACSLHSPTDNELHELDFRIYHYSDLKMEAFNYSETWETTHKTTWRHNPQHHNRYLEVTPWGPQISDMLKDFWRLYNTMLTNDLLDFAHHPRI